jgi:hypothetical protein
MYSSTVIVSVMFKTILLKLLELSRRWNKLFFLIWDYNRNKHYHVIFLRNKIPL